MKKPIVFAMLLMSAGLSHASLSLKSLIPKNDESKSPLGCRDQGYQYKLNVLKIQTQPDGDRQSLFFVFNRSNQPINLYQMLKTDSSRTMPLNHVVGPQQWSVLSTSEDELNYICAVGTTPDNRGKIVNCADSVKVCEYARVKYGLNNRGNYWFSASTIRGQAVRDVLHYGIIPR